MIFVDEATIDRYEKFLEKKADRLDLTDPDDRAIFRQNVQDGLAMTKLTVLRAVLAKMIDTKVPTTRSAVCRALAETQISKTENRQMPSVTTADGHVKKEDDRVFSVYTMTYGVIRNIDDQGWFDFVQDDGEIEYLNGLRISHWVPKVKT